MRKRWTEGEDLVVYRNICRNLDNMQKAFEESAEALGRSINGVSSRWYNHISKKTDSTAFMLLSETRAWNNRKNPKPTTPTLEMKTSMWKRILRFFRLS